MRPKCVACGLLKGRVFNLGCWFQFLLGHRLPALVDDRQNLEGKDSLSDMTKLTRLGAAASYVSCPVSCQWVHFSLTIIFL